MTTQNYIVKSIAQARELVIEARNDLQKGSDSTQRALVNSTRFCHEDGNLEVCSEMIRDMAQNSHKTMMKSWISRITGANWDDSINGFKGKCKEFRTLKINWKSMKNPALIVLIADRWDADKASAVKANLDFVKLLNQVHKKMVKHPDVLKAQSAESQFVLSKINDEMEKNSFAKVKKAA